MRVVDWGVGRRQRSGNRDLLVGLGVVASLSLSLFLFASASQALPQPSRPGEIRYLSGPSSKEPVAIVLDYLRANHGSLGLAASDVSSLVVTDAYSTKASGATHVYLTQSVNGLEMAGTSVVATVTKRGQIASLSNDLVADVVGRVQGSATLSAENAVESAARGSGLKVKGLAVTKRSARPDRKSVFNRAGISIDPIQAKLLYQPVGDRYQLAWQVYINTADSKHGFLDTRVNAATGEVLEKISNINHQNASYHVLALPSTAPNDPLEPEILSFVDDPADPVASPFGWHDTDGVTGNEFSVTRGNNAWAGTNVDADPNNIDPGSEANGTIVGEPNLLFDAGPVDFSLDGMNFRPAGVTNAFYVTNIVHDVMYRHGFDEQAGSFQVNNYGAGGVVEPAGVLVVTQDPSVENNARFMTAPDGQSGVMLIGMAVDPSGALPPRDLAFANDVLVHEYGHGISERLTGGPSTVDCLGSGERASEGWSDFLALVMTARESDAPGAPIGIGTWVSAEPTRGSGGIRLAPYTTDMALNSFTYASMVNDPGFQDDVHNTGFIFATALWEVYWNLTSEYGFNPNLYDSWETGGNILALQLVLDGMKTQPCKPGFVDSRDAILTADNVLTGGVNQCLIWEGFAKRGLGFSARQGDVNNTADGTAGFDVAPSCAPPGPTPPPPTPPPSPPPTPPSAPTPAPVAAAKDTVAPKLSSLKLSRARIWVGKRVFFTYQLSENAKVVFTIKKQGSSKAVGTQTAQGKTGSNRTAFSGRAKKSGKTVSLRRGRYVAELVATDAAGNKSARTRLRFQVLGLW